jgi:putative flippase GtrA
MPAVNLIKSGLAFVAVGSTAALVHLMVFGLLKGHALPEAANLLAFLVAFSVSFAGHRLLSFRDSQTSVVQSLKRFALTSLAGFISNQLLFVVFFRVMQWTDWAALLAALGLAAVQTFVLSRWWAFKR